MAYVTDFTALLPQDTTHTRWNAQAGLGTVAFVTYTFLAEEELPSFSESPPWDPAAQNDYLPFDAARKAAARLALAEYEQVSGLRFIEVDDPALANIRLLGNHSVSDYSWAYYPDAGPGYSGHSYVTITEDPEFNDSNDWLRGNAYFTLLLHELGHAMGLEHPHEGTLLDPAYDNHDYTVMSYDWGWSGDGMGMTRDTLASLDAVALQYLYGQAADVGADWVWSWDETVDRFLLTAGAAADTLIALIASSQIDGRGGADRILGLGGNDTFIGGTGNDSLEGYGGNDRLQGDAGDDLIDGGSGSDTAVYSGLAAVVSLAVTTAQATGHGSDTLVGIENLQGGAGTDLLTGNGGGNTLNGGGGNDTLIGGSGSDTLQGSSGNDRLQGDAGDDRLDGGSGSDTAVFAGKTGSLVSLLIGGAQNTGYGYDTLIGIENLSGWTGTDRLTGDGGANRLTGGSGNDSLYGGLGNDTLDGGNGNDRLQGDAGDDVLIGGDGVDMAVYTGGSALRVSLASTAAQDTGQGNDRLIGIENVTLSAGADRLTGDDQANVLRSGSGNDTVYGGAGNDRIDGGNGDDLLIGGAAPSASGSAASPAPDADTLIGGDGNDMLRGGTGADLLTGGAGADVFVFLSATEIGVGSLRDRITDFATGDLLDFSAMDLGFVGNAAFGGVAGQLRFWASATAGYLSGDIDGDKVQDFSLVLSAVGMITESDLLL